MPRFVFILLNSFAAVRTCSSGDLKNAQYLFSVIFTFFHALRVIIKDLQLLLPVLLT